MKQAPVLTGGFEDAPIQAARAFRAIMTAMARPGEICDLAGAAPPTPLSCAAGCLALTLLDADTPVFLAAGVDRPDIRDWITFHTSAPFAAPEHAQFAIGSWNALPVERFAIGTADYPDRSATLIVECDRMAPQGVPLRGPGIRDIAHLSLPEVRAFQRNARDFPLGLDFFFTCGKRIAALPRTTRVG